MYSLTTEKYMCGYLELCLWKQVWFVERE